MKEKIRVDVTELELEKLIKEHTVIIIGGFIRFDEWFNEITFTEKFKEGCKQATLYLNNKEIDMNSILFTLNLYKRFIETENLLGARRRVDYILKDLLESIILKSRLDSKSE